MYDCIIAGAGPVGCYTAERLAGAGFRVLVLEEHAEIGVPVHCTGIVGEELLKTYGIDESCIRYQVDSVRVHFPSGQILDLPTPIRPRVVDRVIFDEQLAQRARNAGAEFLLNARVVNVTREQDFVTVTCGSDPVTTLQGRLCVIATGAMSNLPYALGFSKPEGVYHTAQVDVEADNLHGIELFLGKEVAPGSFAYMVPVNDTVSKVGLISRQGTRSYFEGLLEQDMVKSRVKRFLGETRYRRMPFGVPQVTALGRVLLVGDAACQLKSTTGGGLFYGMRSADILADTLVAAYHEGDFKLSAVERYDKEWKKMLGNEIRVGLLLRALLENVEDSWWEGIREALETPEVMRLIEDYRDFDHHFSFMFHFFRIPTTRKFLFDLARSSVSNGTVFLNLLGILSNRSTLWLWINQKKYPAACRDLIKNAEVPCGKRASHEVCC